MKSPQMVALSNFIEAILMTKYRVDELEGALLDAAVAKANGWTAMVVQDPDGIANDGEPFTNYVDVLGFGPSTDLSMGGWVLELMEREQISVNSLLSGWEAAAAVDNWAGPLVGDWKTPAIKGRTAKEAVLRCYVASKFGEEVELP